MDDDESVGVLVVETWPVIRSMLRTVLSLNGGWHLVGEADCEDEAVVMARAVQPDAVLMGLHLRGGSGEQVLPQMRQAAPSAALVVLTSDEVMSEDRLALIAHGADEVVEKGIALVELREAVRSAVRRRRASAC